MVRRSHGVGKSLRGLDAGARGRVRSRSMGEPIAYVVNLQRSTERRRHMMRELAKVRMAYEFIEAVDGRSLSVADPSLVEPRALHDGTIALGAGVGAAVGCALSHRAIWAHLATSNQEAALVLEDDVRLPPRLGELASAVANELQGAEAALLYFGHKQPQWTVAQRRSLADHFLVRPPSTERLGGTAAYIVTREAAANLADALLPLRAPVDAWHLFQAWGALETVYCVVPMPIRLEPRFRSTIEFYKGDTLQGRVRSWAERLPISASALAWRRQRRFRSSGWTGDVAVQFEEKPAFEDQSCW